MAVADGAFKGHVGALVPVFGALFISMVVNANCGAKAIEGAAGVRVRVVITASSATRGENQGNLSVGKAIREAETSGYRASHGCKKRASGAA